MVEGDVWATIRARYIAGEVTLNDLAARYGVTVEAILERALRCKWEGGPRADELDRRILIRRLTWALEQRVTALIDSEREATDKDAVLLANLTRTLEKLIELDKQEGGSHEPEQESAEMRDIRLKLEKRIDALTKR